MIQDLFANLLPRINAKFKDITFITNEEGKILINEDGKLFQLPITQNTFNLNCKFSSPTEFVSELTQWNNNPIQAKYPALFINSMTVEESFDLVTIGELVLVTHSDPKWNTKKRDAYSFKPILNNIYRFLDEGIKESQDFCYSDFPQSHSIKFHYFYGRSGLYGGEANTFNDHCDAIEIMNLKLRIF